MREEIERKMLKAAYGALGVFTPGEMSETDLALAVVRAIHAARTVERASDYVPLNASAAAASAYSAWVGEHDIEDVNPQSIAGTFLVSFARAIMAVRMGNDAEDLLSDGGSEYVYADTVPVESVAQRAGVRYA